MIPKTPAGKMAELLRDLFTEHALKTRERFKIGKRDYVTYPRPRGEDAFFHENGEDQASVVIEIRSEKHEILHSFVVEVREA